MLFMSLKFVRGPIPILVNAIACGASPYDTQTSWFKPCH